MISVQDVLQCKARVIDHTQSYRDHSIEDSPEGEKADPFVARAGAEQVTNENRAAIVNQTNNLRRMVRMLINRIARGSTYRDGGEKREWVLRDPRICVR